MARPEVKALADFCLSPDSAELTLTIAYLHSPTQPFRRPRKRLDKSAQVRKQRLAESAVRGVSSRAKP